FFAPSKMREKSPAVSSDPASEAAAAPRSITPPTCPTAPPSPCLVEVPPTTLDLNPGRLGLGLGEGPPPSTLNLNPGGVGLGEGTLNLNPGGPGGGGKKSGFFFTTSDWRSSSRRWSSVVRLTTGARCCRSSFLVSFDLPGWEFCLSIALAWEFAAIVATMTAAREAITASFNRWQVYRTSPAPAFFPAIAA